MENIYQNSTIMFQDKHGDEDKVENDDGFCDIYDESTFDHETESDEDPKANEDFQKIIKKISRPS